jgi:protease I
VGAICIAPVILANAGLLKGKKATVFPDGKEIFQANQVIYTGNQVTIDGRLITGCGPEAAEKFGRELVTLLKNNKN